MGGSIPYSIRRSVIRRWLEGLSRDQIANINQIGTGTVSAIIKECKEPDPEFALLREVAVILKQKGLDLSPSAQLIRLGILTGKRNLTEEEIELFVENVDVHCFKKGVASYEFIRTINEVSELSKKFGVPVGKLPEHLMDLRAELAELKVKIQAIKIEEREALKSRSLTLDLLNEYQIQKPLFERLKATQIELGKIKNERDSIKKDRNRMAKEIDRLEVEKYLESREEEVDEEELDKANEELEMNLNPGDLDKILKEVYYLPGQYTDVIKMIIERSRISLNSPESD
jgi:hypothetical protein